MKKIVITQRIEHLIERNETRDSLDNSFFNLLHRINCLIYPIPNELVQSPNYNSVFFAWINQLNPDGIILSGGNNCGEFLKRDRTENILMNYATNRKLPLLGICKGMLAMGIYSGESVKKITGHVGIRHKLNGLIGREVNSFHNFAIDRCPSEYSIIATSTDGVIEGIRHNELPWEGWMWHPEREKIFHENDLKRIKNLFNPIEI